MSQHSPAPWFIDGVTIKNARGQSVASAGNNRKVLGEELDASLHLIAAAPNLLALVRRMSALRQMPAEVADIVLSDARALLARLDSH